MCQEFLEILGRQSAKPKHLKGKKTKDFLGFGAYGPKPKEIF